MESSHDPSSKDYSADPVTEEAVRAAMAATDTPERKQQRWYDRFFYLIIAVVVVLGTLGTVTGVVATYNNKVQNDRLQKQANQIQKEQDCIEQIDVQQRKTSAALTVIATDDRKLFDTIIVQVFQSKTQEDVFKAFDKFLDQRKKNEAKRAKIVANVPNASVCTLENDKKPSSPGPFPTLNPISSTSAPAVNSTTITTGARSVTVSASASHTAPAGGTSRRASSQPAVNQPSRTSRPTNQPAPKPRPNPTINSPRPPVNNPPAILPSVPVIPVVTSIVCPIASPVIRVC